MLSHAPRRSAGPKVPTGPARPGILTSWQHCSVASWYCGVLAALTSWHAAPTALYSAFSFRACRFDPVRVAPRATFWPANATSSHPHRPLGPRRPHRPLMSHRFHRSHRADIAWHRCVLATGVPRTMASWHPGSPGILDCDRSSELLWVPKDPSRSLQES